VAGNAYLAIPALNASPDRVMLCHEKEIRCYTMGSNLISSQTIAPHAFGFDRADITVHGHTEAFENWAWWVLIIHHGEAAWQMAGSRAASLGWTPSLNDGNTLNQVPLHAVMLGSGVLQLTGLDAHGSIYRSYLRLEDGQADTVSYHPIGSERYRAFACVRTDLTAGIHTKGIDWWTPSRVRPGQTKLTLKNPVAAFPLPDARELLIVEANGLLTRVPVAE
jgi:hypothetical protein